MYNAVTSIKFYCPNKATGRFHKGFAARRYPHCQSYMVSCMPGSEASWGLPVNSPPKAGNLTEMLSAVGGQSAAKPYVVAEHGM